MPVVVLLGAFGALLGLLADRVAARWPEHEDGRVRGVDWRTAVVVVSGAAAMAAAPLRWPDPAQLLVVEALFAALILLLATDLDQRLLPDVVTLPMIPVALVVLLLGWDPLLAGKGMGVVSGLAAAVVAPAFLLVSSVLLRGGIGMGDIKLSVSLGLVCGLSRLFTGFLLASAVSAVVLVVLLASRRLTLRSYIPFGPVIIGGAVIGALLP
jgi:leader peptidase (prepilin peptidase) / N-methyltransferase